MSRTSALIALALLAACSDPKCPYPYVQRGNVCHLCPKGSEPKNDECVSADGSTAVDGTEDDDAAVVSGATNDGDAAAEYGDTGSAGGRDAQTSSADSGTSSADGGTSSDASVISTVGSRDADSEDASAQTQAPDTGAPDASEAGACDASNTCGQCKVPSDCKNTINDCQEHQCNNGTCSVRNKTGASCTTGYCNSLAECVECADSLTCPNSRPYCVNSACTECMRDADCGSATRECKNNACVNRCGDGVIDRSVGEDCEANVGGWTTANCNFLCKQTVYKPKAASCNIVDHQNIFAPGDCPDIPTFTETCLAVVGQACYLSCSTDANCPSGYTCTPAELLGVSGFNPPFAGVCQ